MEAASERSRSESSLPAFSNTSPCRKSTRFARSYDAIKGPSGCDLADYLQPGSGAGRIRSAHSVAVHGRHRVGRLGAERREVVGEDPLVSRIQHDHLLGQRFGARKNRGQRVGDRHQGQDKTPRANSFKTAFS
jgi:hypothetical protein